MISPARPGSRTFTRSVFLAWYEPKLDFALHTGSGGQCAAVRMKDWLPNLRGGAISRQEVRQPRNDWAELTIDIE
jgi:hypothetical protein